MTELLRVENLHVSVGKKELLHGINLTVNKGEVHVIMGINGAGKSTLLHAIMGNPVYTITEGRIFFEGQDITELSVDKRAKLGIFLSFQNPISVAGITTENFIRTAKTTISGKQQRLFPFKRLMKSRMEDLAMDPSYAERYLNDGFSGGERKKSEILQMRIVIQRDEIEYNQPEETKQINPGSFYIFLYYLRTLFIAAIAIFIVTSSIRFRISLSLIHI